MYQVQVFHFFHVARAQEPHEMETQLDLPITFIEDMLVRRRGPAFARPSPYQLLLDKLHWLNHVIVDEKYPFVQNFHVVHIIGDGNSVFLFRFKFHCARKYRYETSIPC